MDRSDGPFLFAYSNCDQSSPWSYTMAKSAPLSANSIWSDAASQLSDNTSVNSDPPIIPSSPPFPTTKLMNTLGCDLSAPAKWSNMSMQVPIETHNRQYLERGHTLTRAVRSPNLVRKSASVYSLVDSSTQMIEAIWPLSSALYQNGLGSKEVLPLREYIQETLRRSGTSYSTLQVTLYYLILIKSHVLKQENFMGKNFRENSQRTLLCGRRMFLSALILASKYLQDRNFTTHAWSKISGLDISEINQNEITFLLAVDWQLHITETIFQRWTEILSNYISVPHLPAPAKLIACREFSPDWKSMILGLSPQLDNVYNLISPPTSQTIYSPCSLNRILEARRHNVIDLNAVKSSLNTSQYKPCILEPSYSSRYAKSRIEPTLGLLSTPLNSLLENPNNAQSGLEKLQTGNLMNQDTLNVISCCNNHSVASLKHTLKPHKSSQNIVLQPPTLLISPSGKTRLTTSRLNLPPLTSMPCMSCPPLQADTSRHRFRRSQYYSKGKIINLNKIKVENRNLNIMNPAGLFLESNMNGFMELCPEKYLRPNGIEQSPFLRSIGITHSPGSLYQRPVSPRSYVGANLSQNQDLFGQPHVLPWSRKRSAGSLNYSLPIWNINDIRENYSHTGFVAPRKRLCCAIKASSLFNENLNPIKATDYQDTFTFKLGDS